MTDNFTELRKRLLETLHFGHAGATKLTAEAKMLCWPNLSKEKEDKTKNCVACKASIKNLKYQLLKHEVGTSKTQTEPRQEFQIVFFRKTKIKS